MAAEHALIPMALAAALGTAVSSTFVEADGRDASAPVDLRDAFGRVAEAEVAVPPCYRHSTCGTLIVGSSPGPSRALMPLTVDMSEAQKREAIPLPTALALIGGMMCILALFTRPGRPQRN